MRGRPFARQVNQVRGSMDWQRMSGSKSCRWCVMAIRGRMGWLEAAQSAKYTPQSWSVYLFGWCGFQGGLWSIVG